jgi:hypothetical protein
MGQWQSDDGGDIQIRSANTAILEVQMKGDSALASWKPPQDAPVLELRGTVSGGKLVVRGQRDARVNLNGEESTVTLTITLELDAPAGGAVSGVMKMTGGPGGAVWRTAKGKKAT